MSKLAYRPEIDGLRAIAVMAVVLFHFGLGCEGGFVGVDVFFVISGYLITRIIYRDLQAGTFTLKQFWIRRIRRIAPALIVVSVVTFIVGMWLIYPDDLKNFGKSVIFQAIMLSNVYFYKQDGYFDTPPESTPLLHTWSLSIEEQYYLIFPLLFAWLYGRRGIKKTVNIFLVILVVSLAVSIVFTPLYSNASFYLLPARMWEFLIGALLAICPIVLGAKWVKELSAALGVSLILLAVFLYDETVVFPGYSAVLPCLGTALVILGNNGSATLFSRLLSCAPMQFIGKISYSLYLWHWPLVTFTRYASYTEYTVWTGIWLLVVSFILAWLSWKYVETPFRLGVHLKNNTRMLKSYVVITLAIIGLGFWGYKGDGQKWRFSDEVLAVLEPENLEVGIKVYTPSITETQEIPLLTNDAGSKTVPVLVWGDSHAEALIPAFHAISKEKKINLYTTYYGGCPPIIGVETVASPFLEKANDTIIDLLEKHQIKECVLIARWSLYPEGTPGKNYKNAVFNSSGNTSRDVFQTQMKATLDALHERGIRVWIVKQIPEQRYNATYALANAMRFNAKNVDWKGLAVPLKEYRKEQAWVNEVLDGFASEKTKIIEVEPQYTFGTDRCLMIKDGQPLYRDKDHVNTKGALLMKEEFEKVLDQFSPSK